MANISMNCLLDCIKSVDVFSVGLYPIPGHYSGLELHRASRVVQEFLTNIMFKDNVDYSDEEEAIMWEIFENENCMVHSYYAYHDIRTNCLLLGTSCTWLIFTPEHRLIIDRRNQEEGDGAGGFFATQSGTAFGRFLGQGFIPEELTEQEEDYLNISLDELEPISKIRIFDDNAVSYIDENGEQFFVSIGTSPAHAPANSVKEGE